LRPPIRTRIQQTTRRNLEAPGPDGQGINRPDPVRYWEPALPAL